MTMRIAVTELIDLSDVNLGRLLAIDPNPSIYSNEATSGKEWLDRCKGHEIVCSGKAGMTEPVSDNPLDLAVYHLDPGTKVFYPYATVANVEQNLLREAGITFAYAPGSNKEAVAEWVIMMCLALGRRFPSVVNQLNPTVKIPRLKGLAGNRIAILGMGNVGWATASLAAPMGMRIATYTRGYQNWITADAEAEGRLGVQFERFSGEQGLYDCVSQADYVINCFSRKPSNAGLLNLKFFRAIKRGGFFVSMTNILIWDRFGLFEVLDQGHLAGAAIDVGDKSPGNVTHPIYVEVANHPLILATGQTAHYTDHSQAVSHGMMLDSMEALARGTVIPHLWA